MSSRLARVALLTLGRPWGLGTRDRFRLDRLFSVDASLEGVSACGPILVEIAAVLDHVGQCVTRLHRRHIEQNTSVAYD
jgi:hypothetical protein